MKNRLVCQCANVTETDVKKFIEIYPEANFYLIKNALNIGKFCGSCIRDSHHVDINIKDLLSELQEL